MRSLRMTRGFTLIELLVVIAIIAILASILFPVFGRAREKARQTKCTSNLKQLATALQIYAQENNGRYPGSDVFSAIDVNTKVMSCPSSQGNEGTDVGYGFNGLLIRTDEASVTTGPKGVSEAQVKSATEVGAFADTTPMKTEQEAKAGQCIINGGGKLGAGNTVSIHMRHQGGMIASFCDGHAKFFKANEMDEKNLASPVTRAFVAAVQLGILDNPGGGIETAFTQAAPASPFVIGGDYCTRPILAALADQWKGTAFQVVERGFVGAGSSSGKKGNFAWGDGGYAWLDPAGAGTPPAALQFPARLGDDALVVIVAKNSSLAVATAGGARGAVPWVGGPPAVPTVGSLSDMFYNGTDAGNAYQAYTYDTNSGSRRFFYGDATVGLGFPDWKVDAGKSVTVANDLEMVEKVSQDSKGIGYCSAAMADSNYVTIIGYDLGATVPPASPKSFPNPAAGAPEANKYRWPASINATTWPLARTLFADCASTTIAAAISNTGGTANAVNPTAGAAVEAKAGTPLFKCGYF